jgi:hypothetical protein
MPGSRKLPTRYKWMMESPTKHFSVELIESFPSDDKVDDRFRELAMIIPAEIQIEIAMVQLLQVDRVEYTESRIIIAQLYKIPLRPVVAAYLR